MKKTITLIILLCLTVMITLTGCSSINTTSQAAAAQLNSELEYTDFSSVGGYTSDRDLTAEDAAVFEEATDGLIGVIYEPVKVATQIVAGTNYRFTCYAIGLYPRESEITVKYVYIYKDLSGNIELLDISDGEIYAGAAATEELSGEQVMEVLQAYRLATVAMEWLKYGNIPGDDEGFIDDPDTGIRYYRVTHHSISTMAELENHFKTLFTEEMVNELSQNDFNGRFKEADGMLYVSDFAMGGNILKGSEVYEFIPVNDQLIQLHITVEDLAEPQGEVTGHTIHDMFYELIDGKWVFSNFELVR